MAYRDELETRRAHLERLETRLSALKAEEARIAQLPGDEGGAQARLFGGPKHIERTYRLEGPLDVDALRAICDDVYEVDGRIETDGDAIVWQGHPEPRPRNVTVRLEPRGKGWQLRVRDEGSYRIFLSLLGFLGLLAQFRDTGSTTLLLAAVFFVTFGGLFWRLRKSVRQAARRRIVQAERVSERATAASGEVRARVEIESESDDVEVEPAMARARSTA